jgi:hypothetical protein
MHEMNYLMRFSLIKFLSSTVPCFLLFLTVTACSGNLPETSVIEKRHHDSPPLLIAMNSVAHKQFVFGHHSVGGNILSGLKSLSSRPENPQINIIELSEQAPVTRSGIYHFSPGKNKDPISKIDAFVTILSSSLERGLHPDAVILKFCYVDFTPRSDVKKLFSYYQNKMADLNKNYPALKVLHSTVPLTTRPTNMKAKLKRLLGLEVWDDSCNLARNKYNTLLRQSYQANEIFDIAKIESTGRDGTIFQSEYKHELYNYLAPEYTDDGGHLNELGSRRAASEFVFFLAQM